MFKKEIIFGIIGSVLIIFLTLFYAKQYSSMQSANSNLIPTNTVTNLTQPPTISGGGVILSLQEVKKHKSPNDCWMIISGGVYNVSSFDVQHPGGSANIDSFCGTDATQAFLTRGGTGSHSVRADQMLAQLLIGKVNDTINQQKIDAAKSNLQNLPQQNRGEDD